MSGLLKSIADRWHRSTELKGLVPFARVFTGRVPHTKFKALPYVSVIEGGGWRSYRSDRTDCSRIAISFHIWVNDSELHTGELIEDAIRRHYANSAWSYDVGRVTDVLDEGPGIKHQVTEPNYEMWEIVKIFTFCLEQDRADTGVPCGSSSSAAAFSDSSSS